MGRGNPLPTLHPHRRDSFLIFSEKSQIFRFSSPRSGGLYSLGCTLFRRGGDTPPLNPSPDLDKLVVDLGRLILS